MQDEPGCGVSAHPDDCLCDVHITSITPITKPLDLSRQGRAIARAIGYTTGDATYLDYAKAMMKAADVRSATFGMANRINVRHRDRLLELLRSGVSMVDVPAELGIYVQRRQYTLRLACQVLTSGSASKVWMWDELEWLRFETALDSGPPMSENAWAKEFDLHRETLRSMEGYYGRELPRGDNVTMSMHILFRPWDEPATEVVQILSAQYPTITLGHVTALRDKVTQGRKIRCPDHLRHLLNLPVAA